MVQIISALARNLVYVLPLLAFTLSTSCQGDSESGYTFTDLGGPPKVFAIGGGASSSEPDSLSSNAQFCVTGADCDDDDRCTADSCDAVTGKCIHFPIDCPEYCETDNNCYDGNPCTLDLCGIEGICTHDAEPECEAKECAELKECDDGDPCTQDACLQGWCNHTNTCAP